MRSITFVLFIFLTMLAASMLHAQKPFIQNYSPKDYRADLTNFDVIQGANGMMYFANGEGVLVYDGQRWTTIPVPGKTVRALALGEDGRIYVGTVQDFGYLDINSKGNLVFQSLVPLLPKEEQEKVGTTWNIFQTNSGILFCGQKKTYCYNPQQTPSFKIWSTAADYILHYYVHGTYYVLEDDLLMLNEQDELVKVPNSEAMNDAVPVGMEPIDDGGIMVVTSYSGVFAYYPDKQQFEQLNDRLTQWFIEQDPYETCLIPKGIYGPNHYGIASTKSGALVINQKGEVVQQFNEGLGLRHNTVYELETDRNGSLWLALVDGVAKVSVDLAVSVFDRDYNVKSYVHAVRKHEETLYIGTNLGLFYLNDTQKSQERFEMVDGLDGQTWKLVPYGKGMMVAGGNSGIFYVENRRMKSRLPTTSSVMSIGVSSKDSSIIYVPMYNGFQVCRFNGKSFEELGRVPGIATDCRSIEERADGKVWLGTSHEGYYLIDFGEGRITKESVAQAKVKQYAMDKGLIETSRNKIYPTSDKWLFTSEKAVYTFNEQKDQFELFEHLPIDFSGDAYSYPACYEIDGNLWIGTRGRVLIAQKETDGSYAVDSLSLRVIEGGASGFFKGDNEEIYIANGQGLFVYDAASQNKQPLPPVIIRDVLLTKNDSLLLDATYGRSKLPSIEYSNNALQFSYALPHFYNEGECQFQYWLDGYEEHWSSWHSQANKEYTNLKEGRYLFRVRARSALGELTGETTLEFEVLAPWYRKGWAWFLYIALGLLMVFAAVKAYAYRLIQAKKRLERIVAERTEEIRRKSEDIMEKNAELAQQKEEIELQAEWVQAANEKITKQNASLMEQKVYLEEKNDDVHKAFDIIQKKNKDITASINYAQRIQQAVLPFQERLQQMLPEHALLFWPKDIVSGDFYWVEQLPNTGEMVIAVADCTGHGVPGAFMSLVGDFMLNQTIFHEGITNPAEILEALHEGVQKALKQQETGNQDGMDIAICIISADHQTLRFAGAKRPLIYVKDGNLEEIKGDIRSIGGKSKKIPKPFTCHELPIDADTIYYLFSDGVPDQIGGAQGRKLMTKRFKLALQRISQRPLDEQQIKMTETLKEWMEGYKQVDDILLLGFKAPPPSSSTL